MSHHDYCKDGSDTASFKTLASLPEVPSVQCKKGKIKKPNSQHGLNNLAVFHRSRNSFSWGQKASGTSPRPDQRQIINSEPPVVVRSGVLLRLDFLKLSSEAKRLLRQSNSISPTRALPSTSLNWMPQNNCLIMWLSEKLSCFPNESGRVR